MTGFVFFLFFTCLFLSLTGALVQTLTREEDISCCQIAADGSAIILALINSLEPEIVPLTETTSESQETYGAAERDGEVFELKD